MCQAYWLNQKEALVEARYVASVVEGWRRHFEEAGIDRNTIELLADQIDRPYLREQRLALSK
jgi:serine/threonine-protein kinase HipA